MQAIQACCHSRYITLAVYMIRLSTEYIGTERERLDLLFTDTILSHKHSTWDLMPYAYTSVHAWHSTL